MTDTPSIPVEGHVPIATRAFDEGTSELARTYAEALVNAAQKSGNVDEILEELDAIRDFVLRQYPKFAHMMNSPLRSTAEKDRIIGQAFEGRVLETSVNFLRVLNRHGRLNILGPVLKAAREVADRRQNRKPVTVRSAVPLAENQAASLHDKLASALGATPVITYEVVPALIGGLVVQVGDDLYDASLRNRLEQLRQRLIEGKTHEIQSRRDHFSHSE